jgi:hypothetical protein
MPYNISSLIELAGVLLRAAGFLVLGYALARFTIEAYRKAVWQLQIALALGFFALLVGLTHYASPGAVGAFALGAGVTFLREYTSRSEGQDS